MQLVEVTRGSRPIILAQPHSGLFVPKEIASNLNSLGKQLLDTDWHIPKLYDGLLLNATLVKANFNRYVIDPNRAPTGESLYPGQNSTGLVPLSTFDGAPIWNTEPNENDIQNRVSRFHDEYHQALRSEINRLKAKHGVVIIYDCHSIRSKIPHLFDDRLPDLNIGDNRGASCASEITANIEKVCRNATGHSYVINGRFRGGWTTRHYGRPSEGVHAIQMELAQCAYLESEVSPFNYDDQKASSLRSVLSDILDEINNTILNHSLRVLL